MDVTLSNYDTDLLGNLVRRVMSIEDTTYGDPKRDYIVRYRGRLIGEDSEASYDTLAELVKPYKVVPLFRWEDGRHSIRLVGERPTPKVLNPWVNLIFFILTILFVLLAGVNKPLPGEFLDIIPFIFKEGWPYAVSILAILGAHEFGHYFVGKAHKIDVSLPYFIPFPSMLGTLGAFINMRSIPKNKRHLLDVGIAGPLSGFAVAVPILLVGLYLSNVEPMALPPPGGGSSMLEGNSIFYLLVKYVIFGQLLPQPASYQGVPVLLYWLRYFFTATPFPVYGTDVMLHPVAWAGWVGLLVTSLNLIPAGQLDGGHILYTVFGQDVMRKIFPFILVILGLLGILWQGWFLWVALIWFFGRTHAEPLDMITELDSKRKALGIFALIIFILTFMPVPLAIL